MAYLACSANCQPFLREVSLRMPQGIVKMGKITHAADWIMQVPFQ
jgi:hypothetical protein